MQAITITLSPGTARPEQLETEVNEVLATLADPKSPAAQAVVAAGLDLTSLQGARVQVAPATMGFGPVDIVITMFANITSHVAKTLWDQILLPRVKGKLGSNAAGKRQEGAAQDPPASAE